MDLLLQCAQAFERLIPYQYHFAVGRKGKMLEFTVAFDPADFHHLAGLHKLRDNARLQTGQRAVVLQDILDGKLTLAQIEKSAFFEEMQPRLRPLSALEDFLDSNEIIFRYNPKIHAFSLIPADYLLENTFEDTPVYLFLSQRDQSDTQFCRTFFPKGDMDYAQGQPRYTLLKKEKINTVTGEVTVQYDRLTPRA